MWLNPGHWAPSSVMAKCAGCSWVTVSRGRGATPASSFVVTAGGWTTKLLAGVAPLPRLRVTQEQPAHFAITDEGAQWPGFNHMPGHGDAYGYWRSPVYGMQTPGEGIKAGWHGVGPVVDPDRRSFAAEPEQRAALQRYARDWLPGVDADSLTDISCTYTTTVDENFVLDLSLIHISEPTRPY